MSLISNAVISLLCALSVLASMLGAAVAYLASRFPQRQSTMEFLGGLLLIGGLALLGSALGPFIALR